MTNSAMIERVPARLSLGILAMLGFVNLYICRANLSVIILAMVGPAPSNQSDVIDSECKTDMGPDSRNNSVVSGNLPNAKSTERYGGFDWDEHIQGLILGAFFWGYTLFQIPGGRFAELFGAKKVFGMTILCGGIASVLSPMAAEASYIALIVVRVLQGACQAASWPSMQVMVARWIPQNERSRFVGATFFATNVGVVLSLPVCGAMIDAHGWESAFYLTGSLSILWCFLWAFLAYDSPSQHPRISTEELEYIQGCTEARGVCRTTPAKVPWQSIAKSQAVWALCIADTLAVCGLVLLLTKVPSYVKNVLGFSIKENGMISALPFLVRYAGAVFWGNFGHQLIKRKITSLNTSRKLCASISTFLPAVCMLGVTYAGCNPTAAVTLLAVSMFFNGAVSGGHIINSSDIAPNYTGTIFGMSNTLASTPGFLIPPIAAAIIDDQHTMERWRKVFWLCIPAYVLSGLIFVFFGSTEVQPWNNISPEEQKEKGLGTEDTEMAERKLIQKKS